MTAEVCLMLSALLLFAARNEWNRRVATGVALTARRLAAVAGVFLLALSAARFVVHFGWEVGCAWFLLWTGLTALAAAVWQSLHARSALWSSPALVVLAIAVWALP